MDGVPESSVGHRMALGSNWLQGLILVFCLKFLPLSHRLFKELLMAPY